MQAQHYPTQAPAQFSRPAFPSGYANAPRPMEVYPQAAYNPQEYQAPNYNQGGYYPHQYMGANSAAVPYGGAPQGFAAGGYRGGRGRGGYPAYAGMRGGYSRGGFRGGRGRFNMRHRHKKPFVGGSLETQRQWEQETVCCFFLQGNCKFGDGCRFLHEKDASRPCQFGGNCRVGHAASESAEKPQETANAEQTQQAEAAPVSQ